MLYTEAEVREALCRMGLAPIIQDAAIEMMEQLRKEHENV